MGFWRGVAYAMDRKMAQEADRAQTEYNASIGAAGYRGPGIVGGIVAGIRASRAADQYWRDNNLINQANDPYAHHTGPSGIQLLIDNFRATRDNDLGHPRGCTCRWCGK